MLCSNGFDNWTFLNKYVIRLERNVCVWKSRSPLTTFYFRVSRGVQHDLPKSDIMGEKSLDGVGRVVKNHQKTSYVRHLWAFPNAVYKIVVILNLQFCGNQIAWYNDLFIHWVYWILSPIICCHKKIFQYVFCFVFQVRNLFQLLSLLASFKNIGHLDIWVWKSIEKWKWKIVAFPGL